VQEAINPSRRRFLGTAAMAVAAAQFGSIACAKARSAATRFDHATTWLNSPPLTDRELQGKVVIVEFWTYSCINWRRQLPYVRAWAEKYRDHGLVVVGVHSPEFSFEKNIDNVRWAANDMRIPYPIAIDNDYSIWRAFNNNYWPALYFIDAKGQIRGHVFGEGQYGQSEALIRRLLGEAGASNIGIDLAPVNARGPEAPADWKDLRSEEHYLGYKRTDNFASSGDIKADKAHVYSVGEPLNLNQWAIAGEWTVGREAIVANRAGGTVSYRFHARDLHLVMGTALPANSVPFRVLLDGKLPGTDHGVDVDEQGNGTVVEQRMYQLIRQQQPVIDRQFTIQFLDSGVEAFSFTFG
jgi:thiol-disulfide isomerase/thioredoxin